MAQAVRTAWEAGITVVCAAGNEGEFGLGGILSPGNEPHVITVGATDTKQTPEVADDRIAAYSPYGPTLYDEYAKPDLVAPGNRNISLRTPGSYIDKTFPENVIPLADYWDPAALAAASPSTESDYLMLSGTSTSAPVVAGAVALMLEDDSELSPDDVKLRLMAQRRPGAPGDGGRRLPPVPAGRRHARRARGPRAGRAVRRRPGALRRPRRRRRHPSPDVYLSWAKYAWTKYAWTKYALEQVRVDEVRLDEVRVDQVRVDEICLDQVRVDEVRMDEICLDKVRVDEVRVDGTDRRAVTGAAQSERLGETAARTHAAVSLYVALVAAAAVAAGLSPCSATRRRCPSTSSPSSPWRR